MVAKDESGNNVNVPKLILSDMEEVRRFYDSINRIQNKKKQQVKKGQWHTKFFAF